MYIDIGTLNHRKISFACFYIINYFSINFEDLDNDNNILYKITSLDQICISINQIVY